jgi:hypothetical protein
MKIRKTTWGVKATFAALLIGAVSMLGVTLADAAWNTRQNQDGSAVWVNENSKTVPVGDSGLTVDLTDISTASTTYVVTHKPGKIKKIYSTIHAALTGPANALIDASIKVGGTTWTAVGSSTTNMTVTWSGSAVGDVDSFTPDANNSVAQGEVIAIHTDGGTTNTSRATITIIIE